MVLFDLFDCGLLGDKVMPLLGALRRHALQPGAVCVPAAATLYVMGLEVHKTAVGGFDLSPLDKYRWEPGYEQARLHELPHTQLTAPRRVFETFFDGSASTGPGTSSAQDGLLKLDVLRSGTLNAVVFWFDLHLDEDATITSAPAGFGPGGEAEPARVSEAGELVEFDATCGVRRARERVDSERYWGQAVQYLESSISVEAGAKQALLFRVEAEKLSFSLKPAEGAYVAKPPWRITWGGGASVESPHFQRVHYCELLVKDFLMRVTCRRFPPIEKDLRMVLAHCGSLFLDPASLAEAFRELVGLEALHLLTDVSAWASAEAVYKRVQLVA
jgi:protein arginine N-methyltransferase 7